MISDKHLTANLNHYLHCFDHSVSQEQFELMKNNKYDLLVTHPVPEKLATYYESETYISHTDGKGNLLEKIYQLVKTYTLQQKLKLINKQQTNNKRLLDIGAGTGEFLKYCNKNGWQTDGVEPSQHARNLAQEMNIKLFSDISEINENKYDIITLWHVLEHIPNLTETLEKLKNMLDVGGRLIIAVPNYKSNDAKYYGAYWAAYDVPRHLWHFSQLYSFVKDYYRLHYLFRL